MKLPARVLAVAINRQYELHRIRTSHFQAPIINQYIIMINQYSVRVKTNT